MSRACSVRSMARERERKSLKHQQPNNEYGIEFQMRLRRRRLVYSFFTQHSLSSAFTTMHRQQIWHKKKMKRKKNKGIHRLSSSPSSSLLLLLSSSRRAIACGHFNRANAAAAVCKLLCKREEKGNMQVKHIHGSMHRILFNLFFHVLVVVVTQKFIEKRVFSDSSLWLYRDISRSTAKSEATTSLHTKNRRKKILQLRTVDSGDVPTSPHSTIELKIEYLNDEKILPHKLNRERSWMRD